MEGRAAFSMHIYNNVWIVANCVATKSVSVVSVYVTAQCLKKRIVLVYRLIHSS